MKLIDIDNINCFGCGVCKNVCPQKIIEIEENQNGCYKPKIDTVKCIHCNICNEKCMATHNDLKSFNIKNAYYGYSNDKLVRTSGSSGGIFYELAKNIINNGGVVVGASFNQKFEVQHVMVENILNLQQIIGSKYVESKMGNIYSTIKEMLSLEKVVLFSGTPCQIAALRMYLGKDYKTLITVEVFCHGTPRVGVFNKYKKIIEKNNAKIIKFNFRSKVNGWNNPSYEIQTEKRNIIQKHSQNIYHLMFGYHHSLKDACFECAFRKKERYADISLGDFWGVEKYYPSEDMRSGLSAAFTNTEKGIDLIKQCNNLKIKECRVDEILSTNIFQIKQYDKPNDYDKYNDDYKHLSDIQFFKKYRRMYFFKKINMIFKRMINK